MGHAIWAVPDLPEPEPIRPARWVRGDLVAGEAVVWQGRPGVIRPALAAVPVGLFGCCFGTVALAVWWLGVNQPNHDNPGLVVVSIPFVVLGGLMTLAPVWAGWQAGRTRYAITNQRVMIRQPHFWAGVQTFSLGPDWMQNLIRNERFAGRGDLIFEEIRTVGPKGRIRTTRRGFFGVENIRRVETILRATLLTDRP